MTLSSFSVYQSKGSFGLDTVHNSLLERAQTFCLQGICGHDSRINLPHVHQKQT